MAGNSHDRKVAATAIAAALKKMDARAVVPKRTDAGVPSPEVHLGRSSLEAYIFFILANVSAVMSAYGFPVNFWALLFRKS